MITLLLVAAAIYAAVGPQLVERIKAAAGGVAVERRHVVAAALLAGAAIAWSASQQAPAPTPTPPTPDAGLDLRGTFVGPDAAADAATTAALLEEIAAEIEWDGTQPEPLIRTGVAVDDLRVRARELRTRGVSLGEKHPRARAAIKAYLDSAAGTAGGPLTPAQRAAWVAAYRAVARAAANASR